MTLEELEGRIINADCMDILRELPDKSVDLVLTDPPYGIGADKMLAKKAGEKKENQKRYALFLRIKAGTNQFRRAQFLMRFSEFQKIKSFSEEIILRNTCQIRRAGLFGIN